MKNYLLVLLFGVIVCALRAQNFSPTIQYIYDLPAPSFGSSASADLDGDGKLEIVFTTYTNDGKAHCINAEDGSVHWIYDIGGCGDVAPLIYDVNNDDTLDVIVNGSCNPTIFCINGHTGALQWSAYSGGGDSPPTADDIDMDGIPEVLFGNFSGQVRILNGEDGSLAKTIQVDASAIQTEPVLCDVNGDSSLDIIVCNHFNTSGFFTFCFDYASGDTLWINSHFDTTTYYAYHSGALADIDLDGKMEYVIGDNAGNIRAINVENGSVLWTVSGLTSVMSAITIADLDADDTLEVIYNNNDFVNFNDHIGVLNGIDGSLEWSYPLIFSSFRGMAVSDINGNGKLDLVSGHYMGEIIAVEPYTGLLWNYDVDPHFPSGLPYWDVDHGPLIADFDGDDTIEVFIIGGYGTYTPDSMNFGKAFMLNAGTGYCPSWLMFRHDAHRTAFISKQEVIEWCDTSTVSVVPTPSTDFECTVQPNPFYSDITFLLQLQQPSPVVIDIVDIQGRIVKKSTYNQPLSGFLPISIHAPELPSGIYFYRIQTRTTTQSGKIIKN